MMSLFHFASSQTISCKLWAAGTNAYSYISPFPQQRRSQDPKFIDVQAKENENVPRLTKLATPNELPLIYPIRYAYDPVPIIPPYLNSSPSITLTANSNDVHSCLRQNSCQLYPKAANLPYRSSLPLIRCNRHWQAVLNESKTVLQLLAHDQSASDVEVGHGITLARLAKKELKPDIEHRIVLATIYMFPAGDEKKIRAIAALMIIYFIFDDKVEETPDCTLRLFREDFLGLLRSQSSMRINPTPLQSHIDSILAFIHESDYIAGNGGAEMLAALHSAFRCVHPPQKFYSLDEYLSFRRLNVGAAFVIAATKFTIASSIHISTSPHLTRLLTLVSDHLGIVNDIASYEKERRALESGEARDMINIVAVLGELMSLPSSEAAKAAAYAYQLQVEGWIAEEVETLKEKGLLWREEEGWFVEAVLLAATGNVFWSMATVRYGGEGARIGGEQ